VWKSCGLCSKRTEFNHWRSAVKCDNPRIRLRIARVANDRKDLTYDSILK
jgi:hypothetical protein